MRLFAGLIPHSRLSGRTLAVAATNSTGFVAVSAVSQTVKGSMKNISCNNYEQLKDCLPRAGFVRLKSILAPEGPIPVGRSTWWAGVKSGRFPKPVKLGPRTTAWRVEDIRVLINTAE
jgi:prophage regulatory protein